MSFGEHLDELRNRLIKILAGVALGLAISLIYAKQVLAITYWPLLVVLDARGLRPSLMALGVSDPFIGFLKMAAICGLIISMPWTLHQLWMFVSAGLYRHERRFVRLFAPASVGLFMAGVLFMYFIVLPIVLNFFVRFNQSFGLPDLTRSGLVGLLVGDRTEDEDQESPDVLPTFPVVGRDPAEPAAGSIWVNSKTRRLCVQTQDGVLTVPLEKMEAAGAVSSEFSLRFYVSFVLSLSLAFGIAFELPIAVVFLSLTGIVTTEAMARARRYVILGVFIAGSLLTPPDVVSQILLAIPMLGLFEGGLLAARLIERRSSAE